MQGLTTQSLTVLVIRIKIQAVTIEVLYPLRLIGSNSCTCFSFTVKARYTIVRVESHLLLSEYDNSNDKGSVIALPNYLSRQLKTTEKMKTDFHQIPDCTMGL